MAQSPTLERVQTGAAATAASAYTPQLGSPAVSSSSFSPLEAAKGPSGIVIEFGAAFVRCGYAGEAKPRHFLRTPPSVRMNLSASLPETPCS